jgi:hypothetical protein
LLRHLRDEEKNCGEHDESREFHNSRHATGEDIILEEFDFRGNGCMRVHPNSFPEGVSFLLAHAVRHGLQSSFSRTRAASIELGRPGCASIDGGRRDSSI